MIFRHSVTKKTEERRARKDKCETISLKQTRRLGADKRIRSRSENPKGARKQGQNLTPLAVSAISFLKYFNEEERHMISWVIALAVGCASTPKKREIEDVPILR